MNRALLVIDVQESFRQRDDWAAVSTPDIAGRVSRLVDIARSAGDRVIWILHTEPGSGSVFDPDSGHVRLLDGLDPAPGEPVLRKTAHNAFTTTNLAQTLTANGIREVLVCGIRTEQCCETTARLAADLGFAVTFVTEATATTPLPHRSAPANRPLAEVLADPRTLAVHEIIERTEYALAGRFATIRTIDEVASRSAGAGVR